MGHAQWTFISGAKESQGVDGQGTRGLHQNQHTYSCKSYQRISVLVIEVIFKPQNIARSLIQTHTLCIYLPSTISIPYICNSRRRDQIKNQRPA